VADNVNQTKSINFSN